eukprot:m.77986 g.77986  ORF g.77986 m.77986 type:complete len:304 (-) comp25066_c0_seq1:108-1019(-)
MAFDTLMDEDEILAPKQHAVVMLTAMSIAEFAATADMCYIHKNCDSVVGADFALAAGILSFMCCIVLLGMYLSIGVRRVVEIFLALFLAVLWGFAMIVNTGKDGPFPSSNNGYFATWACLLVSWYYLYLCAQKLQTMLDREIMIQNSALATVFIASLFEFSTAAKDCHAAHACTYERAFAVACGVLSFMFSMFQLMFVRLGAPAGIVCAKPIGLFLVVLWSVGLITNTSTSGPFHDPCNNANGFFATWICWGASIQYCYFAIFGPLPSQSQMFEEYGDENEQFFDEGVSTSAYGAIKEAPDEK